MTSYDNSDEAENQSEHTAPDVNENDNSILPSNEATVPNEVSLHSGWEETSPVTLDVSTLLEDAAAPKENTKHNREIEDEYINQSINNEIHQKCTALQTENRQANEQDKVFFFNNVHQGIILDVAANGWRLANYLIDIPFFFFFGYIVGISINLLTNDLPSLDSARQWIFSIPFFGVYIFMFILYFFFYVLFESIFGITPGKVITNTKVVDQWGNTPKLTRIVGRTLARFIPFDSFSFFRRAGGLHDTLSKTYVVNNSSSRKILVTLITIAVFVTFSGIFYYKFIVTSKKPTIAQSVAPVSVSYRSISFSCTDEWIIMKQDENEVNSWTYQIAGRKKGVTNIEGMVLVCTETKVDLHLWLSKGPQLLKNIKPWGNAVYSTIYDTVFKNMHSYAMDFHGESDSKPFYGKIHAFSVNNKSILFLKQAESVEKLTRDFVKIEESLVVK